MEAYCLKCRAKREMNDPKPVVFKNGKTAMQGVCSVCGTKMNKIGGTDAAAGGTATATAAPAKAQAKAPAKAASRTAKK